MLLLRSFIYVVGLYMPANPSRHWPCQQCLCNLRIRIRTVLLNNASGMARWEFCMSITQVKGPGRVPRPVAGVPAPCAHATIQKSTYPLGRATARQRNVPLPGHCAGDYRYRTTLFCNKLRSQAEGIKFHTGVRWRHVFTMRATTQIFLPVGDGQANRSTSSKLNSRVMQAEERRIILCSSDLSFGFDKSMSETKPCKQNPTKIAIYIAN